MYKKVFDPVTQRDVLKWVYVPSQDPGEVKARQEREAWGNRMIESMRPAMHCGKPTEVGATSCRHCCTSFVE
tara:strand:- start:1493 stop:1708 length:216 start_codon:yes stop_codon:yes gene_type:complete